MALSRKKQKRDQAAKQKKPTTKKTTKEQGEAPRTRRSKTKTIQPKTPNQAKYLELLNNSSMVFCTGPAGTGKSLRNSETVFTPNGPVPNGNLRVGDEVCTPDGKTANILGIYPQGKIDIYRITFSDGATVDCSADHLWVVEDRERFHKKYKGKSRLRTVDTKFIQEKINKCSQGDKRFSIPTSSAVKFRFKKCEIDPYVLGLLIGDGSISTAGIKISTADNEILDSLKCILGDDYSVRHLKDYDYGISYNTHGINPLTNALRDCELFGTVSNNKFVPSKYLINSKATRLAVVQGLMDTDGTVDKKSGCPSFCTVSNQLALDFKFLIESLGGICNITTKKTSGQLAYMCWPRYNNAKNLFRLTRKKDLAKNRTKYPTKRIIRKIECIGQDECTCIYIDHPSHLYLTNHFISTHNTFLAVYTAAQKLMHGDVERLILCRPAVEAGEKFGFLPGDLKEKIDPYLQPAYDALYTFLGHDKVETLIKKDVIVVSPLAFMRGRTFSNAFVILDEAQNVTRKQMKMFLTRMGDNTTMVINGDRTQTDLRKSDSGLLHGIELLSGIEGIDHFEMTGEDIVRHPLVKKILFAYEIDEKNHDENQKN